MLAHLEAFIPVMIGVKVLLFVLCSYKLITGSGHEPFLTVIFGAAGIAAVLKVIYFGQELVDHKVATGMAETMLQDMSFILVLVGVVVTMGMNFLWALSRAGEKGIFDRNISETDFVANLLKREVLLVAAFVGVRLCPKELLPCDVELVFNGGIDVVLVLIFGFCWYCLWTVHGTSSTEEFKLAYSRAFIVISLCTVLVIGNVDTGLLLVESVEENVDLFYLIQHCLETTGILCIVLYYAVFYAPASDLKDHAHSSGAISGLLRAQAKFRSLVGKGRGTDPEKQVLVEG